MRIKIKESNTQQAKQLAKELGTNFRVTEYLLNKGYDKDEIKLLISKAPLEEQINFDFKKVNKTIIDYVAQDTNIYIFGDYDSDGINSVYIAYDALQQLSDYYDKGCNVSYHIPERTEGYGLSIEWCEKLVENNNNKKTLVITVDNGITKVDEVDYLLENNIDVIITDHHLPQNTVPNCPIVDLHYNTPDDKNGCGLCGAAVIYKLMASIFKSLNISSDYYDKYKVNAGVATITDMMPITQENIILVKNAMYLLNEYPYEDYDYSLISEAMYYYADFNKGANLTPKDIAFGLGPQLNSCGRLNNVQLGIEYLLSDDYDKIEDIYNDILELNDKRKALKKEYSSKISIPEIDELCVVEYFPELKGLTGNVANELLDKTGLVTCLITGEGDELGGSARAPQYLDLSILLSNEVKLGHLISFGGHAGACGFQIRKDMIDEFKASLNNQIVKALSTIEIDDTLYVDRKIETKDLNNYTINQYKDVMFFNDLKQPILYMENAVISKVGYSKNNHDNIKFAFIDEKGKEHTVWSWGFTPSYEAIGSPKKVNVAFRLEKFNNMFVMDIVDMKAS